MSESLGKLPESTAGSASAPFVGAHWQRFGYWVREIRPKVYRVEDQGSRVIGFITAKGSRYQARSGYGSSVTTSEVLGSFNSARAALRLVIGHYELEQLRDHVRKEVIELEQADPNATKRVR
ncbi:MAG: hypothetical protein KF867_04150 [Cryobacterium sp.]|nr:hypothetical protein [Cryobacterium sp.]MBX3104149.1 hypothetical protein [Cryobacterium sp.]